MRLLAAALLLPLSVGPLWATSPDRCAVPDSLLHSEVKLERTAVAIAAQRVQILVLGTGSSSLAGAQSAQLSYPGRLEAALKGHFPGISVGLTVNVRSRRTAADMVGELDKILQDVRPNLVVWQTGTVDAVRGVNSDEFRATLEAGVDKVRAAQADLILIDTQYSPRTETMIPAADYAETMRHVAQQREVALFDRFAVMKHWSENGTFDFASPAKPEKTAEGVHECIGALLASVIWNGVKPPDKRTQETQ